VLWTIAIYAYLAMPMTAVAVAWMVIRPIICPDQTSDRGLLATATWPVLTAVVVVTALLSPVQFLLCGISLLLACLHLELRIQQEGRPLLPERRLVLWGLLALALVAVSLVIIVVPPLNLGKGWRYVGLEHPVPMISWATLVLVAVAMLLAIPFAARTWLGRRLPWFDPTGLARCLRGRTLLLLGSAAVVGYVLFTLETPWRAIQNCIHAGDGDGG
jgi:hypothetical protein